MKYTVMSADRNTMLLRTNSEAEAIDFLTAYNAANKTELAYLVKATERDIMQIARLVLFLTGDATREEKKQELKHVRDAGNLTDAEALDLWLDFVDYMPKEDA